jgi:hypothetical protein
MVPPGAALAGSAAPRGGAGSVATPVTGGAGQPGAADAELDAGVSPPSTTAPTEPLSGAPDRWTFLEIRGAQCRDGSAGGVFLNLGTSKGLMIFLEGGGRCSDAQTCSSLNPANVRDGDLVRSFASAGVLNRSGAENPVRDWNFVVIPYCTGDRHGGANPDGAVAGVGPQKFVGYTNMQTYLGRIVATFPDASDVVFTGISAGGFGVAYLAPLVQRAFPRLKIKPIIDSAPFVSNAVFKPCDQKLTRELYKADQTFLGECGAACPDPLNYWLAYGSFFAQQFGDRPWGLISTTEDAIERAFFGIGLNECKGTLDFTNPGIPADAYRAELLELRNRLATSPGFATFYPEADTHTFIAFDDFYTTSAGGVRLVDWFTKIVRGDNPGHAGP